MIATVPRGGEFIVIAPVFRDYRAWRAKWTKLVWQKSTAWTWLLQRDPRVKLVAHVVTDEIAVKKNYFKPVQAFVYRRGGLIGFASPVFLAEDPPQNTPLLRGGPARPAARHPPREGRPGPRLLRARGAGG